MGENFRAILSSIICVLILVMIGYCHNKNEKEIERRNNIKFICSPENEKWILATYQACYEERQHAEACLYIAQKQFCEIEK